MIVLDIAIGIVLIYFLYSLLSSIIAEIISSWIGMRARMLKQGIDNILNDKEFGSGQDFKKWIQDIFLVEDNNFRYTNAGKFYEEPTIKYLAKPGEQAWYSLRNRKPAYVSPETFVITVLNMFSNKGRGISEWDKIKFAIETNAMHLEPETLKMFQDLVKRSNDNFKNFVDLLLNHFADTMDRVNGWYKRKIGTIIFYIGLFLCTIFNVDTFQIINTLSNDKEKRLQMVELAEKVIEKKAEIEILMSKTDSLNELKYQMQAHAIVKDAVLDANDIIATGWNFKMGLRKEAICISEDPICLRCITESQAKYVEDSVILSKGKRDKITLLAKQIKDDQLKASVIKVKLDSISFLENDIKKLSESIQDTIGLSFLEYDTSYRIKHIFWIEGPGYPSFTAKATVILKAMAPWKPKFWGIVLTALALTLGAQFWFDLLKKLVSIRSSGVKPEESEEKKRQITQLKLEGEKVTSKDPVEIAISENRAYWESLPGFIGVNKVIKNSNPEIELLYENLPNISESVDIVINNNNNTPIFQSIKVNLVQAVKGHFQDSLVIKSGMIRQNSTNILGTVAGIVRNNRTGQRSLLTCGHVARTDYSNFIDRRKSNISFLNSKDEWELIGQVSNLNLSSYVDGALIDITDFTKTEGRYTHIKPYRKLVKSDENNLDVKINTLSGIKNGKIVRIDKNHAFDDKVAGDIKFFDLIQIESTMDNKSIKLTENGDSGALITDNSGEPIGILVGATINGNEHYSYGIKMQDLLEILQAEII
jgi:hypothetical protein